MERRERSKFNTQIYDEACAWFVECRTGDLDEAARSALDHWLRKSPEHLSAYLEVAAIWNEGASLDPMNKWDPSTLIGEAAHDYANVVTLSAAAAPAAPAIPVPLHRARISAGLLRMKAIAASIAMLSVAVGSLIWFVYFSAPTYATGIGEQRFVQLEDGSTVELNSRSKLVVHFSKHQRAVKLIEGQALFYVAKNAARAFVVAIGDTKVRAVGTQFDVYKKSNGTIVTVIEGKVAILTDHRVADSESAVGAGTDPAPASQLAFPVDEKGHAAGTLLSAGEQLTVTSNTAQKVEHANVVGATAWTERQIVFEGASLTDVAQEFNRYNRRQLVIEDQRLDTFHISGVFSSTDSESLIRFLRERPGLQIVETTTEIRIEKDIS